MWLVTFSVLFASVPTFCFAGLTFFVFFILINYNYVCQWKTLKIFSLYFYQLNKSSSDLTNYSFLVRIAFLEIVPTFMEMGFVFPLPFPPLLLIFLSLNFVLLWITSVTTDGVLIHRDMPKVKPKRIVSWDIRLCVHGAWNGDSEILLHPPDSDVDRSTHRKGK